TTAGAVALLQLVHAGFEFLELLPRAQQHGALHVELFTGHEFEPLQAGLQHGLEVLLEVLARLVETGGYQLAQSACEIVEGGEIDHGDVLAAEWFASETSLARHADRFV